MSCLYICHRADFEPDAMNIAKGTIIVFIWDFLISQFAIELILSHFFTVWLLYNPDLLHGSTYQSRVPGQPKIAWSELILLLLQLTWSSGVPTFNHFGGFLRKLTSSIITHRDLISAAARRKSRQFTWESFIEQDLSKQWDVGRIQKNKTFQNCWVPVHNVLKFFKSTFNFAVVIFDSCQHLRW